MDCDDDNVCTNDLCHPVDGCLNLANTLFCDDGDACTELDQCADTVCVGSNPLACDDDNVCTDDACDPASGCVFTNNAVSM